MRISLGVNFNNDNEEHQAIWFDSIKFSTRCSDRKLFEHGFEYTLTFPLSRREKEKERTRASDRERQREK